MCIRDRPSSENYVDGDNTMALKISYFDGREVHTLTDAFVVKVPFVYFWENKKVYAPVSYTHLLEMLQIAFCRSK